MKTNNKTLLAIILAIGINYNAAHSAELVGSGFSYQGELLDNGTPANTEYDIQFKAFDALEDGNENTTTPIFLNVMVSNGLFSIENIDFGDMTYEGKEVFLEVSVRKTIDAGPYTALVPRQRIGAVPYSVQSEFSMQATSAAFATTAANATNANSATQADSALIANKLAAGSANMGDILQFGATGWGPVSSTVTPWSINNSDAFFTGGNVGIGIASPLARLHVDSNDDFELSRFDGGNQMYNTYYENGIYRGFIGSFQDGTNSGTAAEDFEIGTPASNTSGKMHITTTARPRISIDEIGQVGIGTTNPTGRLDIDGNLFMNPLTVRLEGVEKLKVNNDGSTSVKGALTAEQTLTVGSELQVNGNTKQSINSDGMLKYMVVVECPLPVQAPIRSYNGTTTAGTITVTSQASNRCKITFPTNVHNRYWVASVNSGLGGLNASCESVDGNNTLTCQIGYYDSGFKNFAGEITVLVY